MRNRFELLAPDLIEKIVGAAQRHWLATLIFALVLAGTGASYTVSNVRINTDTQDMLSDRLPWRVAYRNFKTAFPFFTDTIVVVVDGTTPDLARQASDALARRLAENEFTAAGVFHPAGIEFFRRNQFLYLDTDALQTLADEISAAQPFLARLAPDPGLRGFMTLLLEAAETRDQAPELRLDPVFRATADAINAYLDGDPTPMSWQTLMLGESVADTSRVIFTVQPRLDFSSILPGEAAITSIRSTVESMGFTEGSGVRVRLTGAAALSYDEMKSVVRGAERAGVLAFAMVAICLIVGLRSLSLVAATLLTLIIGLIFTASFAVAAVGTLNMISIAFAVLYVGLGVDFAIHICLRYREMSISTDKVRAISHASRHIGTSIILCAITTAIAFFAFIPTDYRGVAELGLISGVGMFIGLGCSFTILPALLQALPAPRADARRKVQLIAERPQRGPSIILAGTFLLALAAALTVPFAEFDHNPIHLNDPAAESVTTLTDLLDDGDAELYAIDVVAASADPALELAARLEESPAVLNVRTAFDLVPSEQEQKLALIEDLAFVVGPDLELQEPHPLVAGDITALARKLSRRCDAIANSASASLARAAAALALALKRLEVAVESAGADQAPALLIALEDKLMRHFAPQLTLISEGLAASPIDIASLPEDLRRRWISDDGLFRLEILPAQNLDDNDRLAAFVDAVRAITGPAATGTPVINIEASRAVTGAFYQAFASAFILIALVLFFILRRIAEVLVVMAPLLLAGLLTTAATVWAGMSFNFANIIALPLLMGIGVDSALHILHRYKTPGPGDGPLLKTSTARAVLFSALTTTASFGNLAVSTHAGTASMGVMLTIGLTLTILCTLVVLPALLERFVKVERVAS